MCIVSNEMEQAKVKYQKAIDNLRLYIKMVAAGPQFMDCEAIHTLAETCLLAQAEYQQACDDANPPVEMYDSVPSWG